MGSGRSTVHMREQSVRGEGRVGNGTGTEKVGCYRNRKAGAERRFLTTNELVFVSESISLIFFEALDNDDQFQSIR